MASSIAVIATLRSGTGSSPTPTWSRSVQASAAAAAAMPLSQEAVLPQPQLGQAGLVGRRGDRAQPLGRELGQEDRTDRRHGPILPRRAYAAGVSDGLLGFAVVGAVLALTPGPGLAVVPPGGVRLAYARRPT